MNPHRITEDFEAAVADYTGAPYAIATTSCTMAIFLALQCLKARGQLPEIIACPKRTYVSVPMQIVHCGSKIEWRDDHWEHRGWYGLGQTQVIDSARLFTSGMYWPGSLWCTSHHWGKTLGIQQGGMILTDDERNVRWLRRARFDGRTPGVPVKHDDPMIGWHAYMSPEVAALGLMRLSLLKKHNAPLPWDDYPDLSTLDCFKPFTVEANQVMYQNGKNGRDHPGQTGKLTPTG